MTLKVSRHPGVERIKRTVYLKFPAIGSFMAGRESIWESDDCQTAYTDGNIIAINVKWFDKLKPAQQMFLIGHELLHNYLLHVIRMRQYMAQGLHGRPYNHDLGNICMDVLINEALIFDKFGEFIPSGWNVRAMNKRFPGVSVDLNASFEDLYKRVMDSLPKKPPQREGEKGRGETTQGRTGPKSGRGDGQPGPGTQPPSDPDEGTGEPSDDALSSIGGGELDGDVQPGKAEDVAPGQKLPDPLTPTEIMAKALSALAMEKKRGLGAGSGLSRLIEAHYEPTIDWRSMLAVEASRKFGEGRKDWRYPRARPLITQGVYFPRPTTLVAGRLAVGIDTSGSVSDDEKNAYRALLADMVEQTTPERIDVIWCDAKVHRVDTLEYPTDGREASELFTRDGCPGGGGTSFHPPFDWIKESIRQGAEYPNVFIYLTDGCCPFPDQPAYPVIWCITSKSIKAPWGLTIPVIL